MRSTCFNFLFTQFFFYDYGYDYEIGTLVESTMAIDYVKHARIYEIS